MNELQKYFLAESCERLETLIGQINQDFSAERRLEAFRLLHTVKGTAQTFELPGSSKIAHELENLLSRPEAAADESLRALLIEGIEFLIDSLKQNGADNSTDSLLLRLKEKNRDAARKNDILLTRIPPDVFRRFSEIERNAALVALRQNKKILCAEVGFARADFAARYRTLRKALGERGSVIAALPSAKFESQGKIGFQIFLATDMSAEELQQKIENFPGEIISHTCPDSSANDLYEMLSRLAAHAQNMAQSLGKEIEISVLASDAQFSASLIKTIFDLLVHLVRNAVDHAIDREGKIEVDLLIWKDGLDLKVSDNGRGIDLEKIKKCAVAKNLIPTGAELNEEQTLELVFASEVSTACEISEISGRGIGLAAVKDLVDKKGGKISVKNRKPNGTIFEIRLPID